MTCNVHKETDMRLVVLGLLIAAPQVTFAADDADAKARKELTGVWKGRVVQGAKGHILTITKDRIVGKRGTKEDLGEGSFKLDLSKKPWRMDATVTKGRGKGETYLGIYSLKDDVLKWCVSVPGEERPRKFKTEGQQFLLMLKREKSKKKN